MGHKTLTPSSLPIEPNLLDDANVITARVPSIRNLYMESYGCQMNLADSEIVVSILQPYGFVLIDQYTEADLILINTCAIRDKAEQTVRKRLTEFQEIKRRRPDLMIGILGCMAERLKQQLLEEEKIIDLVAGPDAYRDLPRLVEVVDSGKKAINTFLSREETYADINPVRLNSNGVNAFISIMRGCDNMCSFCVVPFTRGRERSRDADSIVKEATALFEQGYREVTLLGQNVDSYKWSATTPNIQTVKNEHSATFILPQKENSSQRVARDEVINFAALLTKVAEIHPDLRIRFSTSHPKDITDQVLHVMDAYDNICKYIHLPVQSGSSRILQLMNRTYDRAWYLERVQAIRDIVGPECGISSDMIAGFCTEQEADHLDTLSLMDEVKYDFAYMFYYSERPGTLAARKYKDDVLLDTKKRRLQEIIDKQRQHALESNLKNIGKTYTVLIEGLSKKSTEFWQGRTTHNKVVIFKNQGFSKGQYVEVLIEDCTPATLLGHTC